MEGRHLPAKRRQIEFVKEQRALNKVFGLTQPEQWSGCKQLIDFLDELFSDQRSRSAQLTKPVSFRASSPNDP
jgi:hypothetical protein